MDNENDLILSAEVTPLDYQPRLNFQSELKNLNCKTLHSFIMKGIIVTLRYKRLYNRKNLIIDLSLQRAFYRVDAKIRMTLTAMYGLKIKVFYLTLLSKETYK